LPLPSPIKPELVQSPLQLFSVKSKLENVVADGNGKVMQRSFSLKRTVIKVYLVNFMFSLSPEEPDGFHLSGRELNSDFDGLVYIFIHGGKKYGL
jgi:hypothetical protein